MIVTINSGNLEFAVPGAAAQIRGGRVATVQILSMGGATSVIPQGSLYSAAEAAALGLTSARWFDLTAALSAAGAVNVTPCPFMRLYDAGASDTIEAKVLV